MKKIDIVGKKFNRWAVISSAVTVNGRARWLCKCDCGTVREVVGGSLKSNLSKSCGCYEADNPSALTHGGRKTRLYRIWTQIKTRCNNKNWHSYHRYGGRGIGICSDWVSDFALFRAWAMESGYKKHLTIDRIDNDGSYCPENCQWVTSLENINKRWDNR